MIKEKLLDGAQEEFAEIKITKAGFKKIEQVYPDWQRAQAKALETLGESTSEMIIASGNKHMLGGMTG